MEEHETVSYCLDALKKAGARKAQCVLRNRERNELNLESNRLNLLRTTFDTAISLAAVLDEKRAAISLNKTDKDSLDEAVRQVIELARASEADSANDISEKQPPKAFKKGPEKPDLEAMYERLHAFIHYVRKMYPLVILEGANFDFTLEKRCFQNTNGVDFFSQKGVYHFFTLFTSKEAGRSSSFNTSGFSSTSLDQEIQNYGSLDALLRQSGEQIEAKAFERKMVGDVIMTPDCLEDFIRFLARNFLSDQPLITGTSPLKDALGSTIADKRLTLCSKPVSEEIDDGYFFTGDGYEAQDSIIIDRGVLKTFLLSLYGAKKTGRPKAVNDGGAYVIDAGKVSLEEMVRSVKSGLWLGRFSGGNPSENGDFSGIAKNSYYIEGGEIQYPVTETMISGNLLVMLNHIRNISQERIDFGRAILPWLQSSGLTISGK
ncbi:MAG: TldD/PmbA family protein [bacterium]